MSRAAVVILFAALTFASVAAVGFGVATDGSRDGTPPAHALRLPGTLLDGEYTLSEDVSDRLRGVPDTTMVGGQYTSGSGAEARSLVFLGGYGRFDDPQATLAGFRAGLADRDEVVLVRGREIIPAGYGEPVTCEVVGNSQGSTPYVVPYCVWVDDDTLGVVTESSSASIEASPDSIDLEEFAALTARVREETRVPAGAARPTNAPASDPAGAAALPAPDPHR
ncbi:hypothetical protein AQ490_08685 [Wenjunlia vitaminophila]|uniref:Uncharacterized protein n=1 Tax=Wenjunlia vitaminophila TaxID=76728 RepID=A0A0T6LLD0_WENVI|nr:hypothetical protein AQ490_08685 [Wenjunlia vitaminophila]